MKPGTIVKCISSLGQTYNGKIIKLVSEAELPQSMKFFFKNCGGSNEYALIQDIEYKDETYCKRGYDYFTKAEYKRKYKD